MKRKKRKGVNGPEATATPATVKGAVSTGAKFGLGAFGLVGAVILLKALDKAIPGSVPPIVKNIGPGIVTAGVSFFALTKVNNESARAGLVGVGIGGLADAVRKVAAAKLPALSALLPTLSGLGSNIPYAAVVTGDFPPNYYERNSFQGTNAYALNGAGVPMNGSGNMSAYALNGAGVPMNGANASAYALN